MRIKQCVLVVLTLLLPLSLWAATVSKEVAQCKAEAFVKSRFDKSAHRSQLQQVAGLRRASSLAAGSGYYVFNVGQQQGFVIVGGDDRMVEILGYSDRGEFNSDAIPDGLSYLLDGYARQLSWADAQAHNVQSVAVRRAAARQSISPLIMTQWNQNTPYNNLCPEVNYSKDGKQYSGKTATGCVATAMAQVMYYHQYPTAATSAVPGYSARNGYSTQAALDPTTFDWNSMTKTYTTSTTGAAADAIAELMQYCGWALQMNYNLPSVGGSSAFNVNIVDALRYYFGYDATVTYAQRQHYTYQQWIDLIYTELAARRPVVLGGQSAGGGHSFVCDGYDTGDYFHINWGWSGSSDGYYRLSALNPWEQGIGGSSTLDGFSFTQDAVVGIRPYESAVGQPCLSLELFQFTSDGLSATQTVSRSTSDDAFTDISLYLSVCSYLYGTNSFDYVVQLVSADGTQSYTLYEADGQSMTFNNNQKVNASVATPAALANGIYYIKVLSRATGQTDWQECYDGHQMQMTAVVSDNELTITAPFVSGTKPTIVAVKVDGNKMVGYEQEVIVSLLGGAIPFHNNLQLYVDGKNVMGKTVDIEAGQSADVRFVYTPVKAGDNVLTVRAAGTVVGSHTETIEASDATNTQDLTLTASIANLADGKLYGNALRVTAHVTNTSADHKFSGRVTCSLRTYADAEAANYLKANAIGRNIVIDESGSLDVPFGWTGLEKGRYYVLRFTYQKGDGEGGTSVTDLLLTDRYEMGEGYLVRLADGTTDILPLSATISVDANAVSVDLTSISTLDAITLTPSTNPNCLYLLADGAVTPDALSECNVVKGSVADVLTLTDGYNFSSPIQFTASAVSYTRTFTVPASSNAGWSTIMLPFAVQTVNCEELGAVDWFHSSSDTGKNFWLKSFTSDAAGVVNFSHATELAAYTPYIIAVPGDTWGDSWRMTGRAVTFTGADATIQPTDEASLSGMNYLFGGTTCAKVLTDSYLLNAAGSNFVSQASATADAFRGWFSPLSISSLSRPSLAIGQGTLTGIQSLHADEPASTGFYTLDGRRLTGRPVVKGLYIINGKKVVVN